jgi:hypothetical protein
MKLEILSLTSKMSQIEVNPGDAVKINLHKVSNDGIDRESHCDLEMFFVLAYSCRRYAPNL